MSTDDVKLPDSDAEDEGSSRASNIVAMVFVVGLIAFNVYAFWGYKDYSAPEVSPDKPVTMENGAPNTASDSAYGKPTESAPQAVVPVPGAPTIPDSLGVSGLSPASSTSGSKPEPPTINQPPAATPASVAGANSAPPVAINGQTPPPAVKSKNATTAPPPGKRPEPVFATATPGAQDKKAKDASTVAPPPGKRPEPIFANPTTGAKAAKGDSDASTKAPPPGKRPEPVFSQYNRPGSTAEMMLSGPQFLLGLGALCQEPNVGLTSEQRKKIGIVLDLLAQDQAAITECANQSLQYFTAEQLAWMETHRGIIDVSNVEPEAGFDPITTAYMRLLRGKKGEAQAPAPTSTRKSELNFQDLMNGVIKMEKENPQLAISAAQAKALMPLLVKANRARQNEAANFQKAQSVLTAKQNAWLKDHPEKTAMNVNDVILRYTRQICNT